MHRRCRRRRDLPALRQAAWKPGSCPSPEAWASKRARPPRQAVQAVQLPRQYCFRPVRSVRLQVPARVVEVLGTEPFAHGRHWGDGGRRGAATVTGAFCSPSGWPKCFDPERRNMPATRTQARLRQRTRPVSKKTRSPFTTGPSVLLPGPFPDLRTAADFDPREAFSTPRPEQERPRARRTALS